MRMKRKKVKERGRNERKRGWRERMKEIVKARKNGRRNEGCKE